MRVPLVPWRERQPRAGLWAKLQGRRSPLRPRRCKRHLEVVNDHDRACMPPKPLPSSEDIAAMVARVAPAVLALLGDGVPRSRRTIVAALADRHTKEEVKRTLMRLAVTDRVVESGGKYTLPRAEGPGVG